MLLIAITLLNLLMIYAGIYLVSTTASTEALGYLFILLSFLTSLASAIIGSKRYLRSTNTKEKAIWYLLCASGLSVLTYFAIIIIEMLMMPFIAAFV